ncbi:MAG: hypothetical protein EOO56_16940 [Hymenobacter sp.]|nr:MAG: hypothetical protein EOO56_16940 [Hymenobacter sp.]
MPARRPSTRTVLTPASRRMVAGLLIAAGALLLMGYALQLYVLLYDWRKLGVLGSQPLGMVALGLLAGALTSYLGWRVGLHQRPLRRP